MNLYDRVVVFVIRTFAKLSAAFIGFVTIVFLIGPFINVNRWPQWVVYLLVGLLTSRVYFEMLGFEDAVIPPPGEADHLSSVLVIKENMLFIMRITVFYEIITPIFVVANYEYFYDLGFPLWLVLLQLQSGIVCFFFSQHWYCLQFYNGKWAKKAYFRQLKEEEKKKEQKKNGDAALE